MTAVLLSGPMALKLACAHGTVRAVRVAQEHGPLGGGGGLVVRGVHVHHWKGDDGRRSPPRVLLDGALVVGLLALSFARGVRSPADVARHWRH